MWRPCNGKRPPILPGPLTVVFEGLSGLQIWKSLVITSLPVTSLSCMWKMPGTEAPQLPTFWELLLLCLYRHFSFSIWDFVLLPMWAEYGAKAYPDWLCCCLCKNGAGLWVCSRLKHSNWRVVYVQLLWSGSMDASAYLLNWNQQGSCFLIGLASSFHFLSFPLALVPDFPPIPLAIKFHKIPFYFLSPLY